MRSLADDGLYIGVTAWTDRTLVESGELYPPGLADAEERLRYYASQFPLTEVDATFYQPLAARNATLWAERTPPDFLFDVKAFRLFTHHPTPPSELWRDLRETLPDTLSARPRIYARDLTPEVRTEALHRFAGALDPLHESGRLGLLLFQFPPYFYPSRRSWEYLVWLTSELPDRRLGVEFRQGRWMDDEHREQTLDYLTRLGLVYVCVDEPQGFAGSLPPVAAATADVAAVRFHGRNAERWAAPGLSAAERYAYDYRPDELAEWVPRIEELHEGGRPVHLLFNNIYRGYAVRNARTLARLLADRVG
ncbi:DUF72 domain-containing protein [Pseudonocardia sp. H11422]|uniref:DUF72 domain-containing protein n=1 Tax=Pseudonocardia sp. H11422 TaxID=2835866 RepID=UPI001BDBB1DD|nr:DUF72 domain-containing protein [Pseudonocardia sp. H11422]